MRISGLVHSPFAKQLFVRAQGNLTKLGLIKNRFALGHDFADTANRVNGIARHGVEIVAANGGHSCVNHRRTRTMCWFRGLVLAACQDRRRAEKGGCSHA